jgi:hypothetical protein
MQEDLHDLQGSKLYIPEPQQDKLEDLADNVPVVPGIDNELSNASIPDVYQDSVPESEQVNADYYKDVEVPPLDEEVIQTPLVEESSVQRLSNGTDWWFLSAIVVLVLSFLGLAGMIVVSALGNTTAQSTFNTAFVNCQNNGGVLAISKNYKNTCEKEGIVYFEDIVGSGSPSLAIQESEAKNAKLVYSNPLLSLWDYSITSNTTGVTNLPLGTYTKTTNELVQKVTINNSFLQTDSSYNNDFTIQKVKNFLDNTTEFQGTELLGDESLVLKAFQNSLAAAKSKTISELQIGSSSFEKTRSVWGVDGAGDDKFVVKARLFGVAGSNIIMVETTLPYSSQQKLLKEVQVGCQQKNKASADILNCYTDQLKNDTQYKTQAEESLKSAITNAGL